MLLVALGLTPGVARAGVGQWTNRGLPGLAVQAVVADPVDASTVYASAREGTYKSTDGGETWTRIAGPSEALIVDPKQSSTLYAGGPGLSKSLDGGQTWSPAQTGLSCLFVTALAIDPSNPAILLAGTADLDHEPSQCGGLFRSQDFGSTWSEILPAPIAHGGLAFNPRVSAEIFAIRFDELGNSMSRSEDGGSDWIFSSTGLPYPLGVLPHPAAEKEVFAAGIDGVYVSDDKGETWGRSGLDGVIVTVLLIDPENPDRLLVGTLARGISTSYDHGLSWSSLNAGLTDLSVSAMAIDASGTRIFAGTNGGGVFDLEFVARSKVPALPNRPGARPVGPRP